MGRLVMEMLGQDLKILSLKEVTPGILNLKIEDTTGENVQDINVNFKDFVKFFNTLVAGNKQVHN